MPIRQTTDRPTIHIPSEYPQTVRDGLFGGQLVPWTHSDGIVASEKVLDVRIGVSQLVASPEHNLWEVYRIR